MNLVELAQRIKARRLELKMTLEEMASRTDLTVSALSKIENFRVTPSLPALSRIAVCLRTTVSDLAEGLDQAQPRLVVVRKDERKIVERDRPSSKIKYQDLASPRHHKVMAPLMLEVPPGIARKELLAHEGEEFLMVVKGEIALEYGADTHELSVGDCAYFDAREKHRLVNRQKEKAEVLCVFTGGENGGGGGRSGNA